MKKYLDGGVTAYIYWNIVLADKGTSSWGWNQNALIQIDKTSRKITYTPEYYAFKHFSCFIPVGSSKVESAGSFNNVVAFASSHNEEVIVIYNPESTSKPITIKTGNKFFTAVLQGKSFNTFTLKL